MARPHIHRRSEIDVYVILAIAIFFSLFLLCLFSDKIGLSKKSLIPVILLMLGLLLTIIYISNPYRRVFSIHGFIHTSITYQVLDGAIPPFNPFLGGISLNYPWGYHVLTAAIMDIFNISPFLTFALINITALFLVGVLIYKISRLVIKNPAANCLSVLFALFGVFIWNRPIVDMASNLSRVAIEKRGIPAIGKFTNINAAPLGLFFFILFLYTIIKILISKRTGLYFAAFFLSILGCGFFYPAMFFAILASALLICLASIAVNKKNNLPGDSKKILLLGLILVVGTLLLWPYFSSISSGLNIKGVFFSINTALFIKILVYLLFTVPTLLLLYISRDFLAHHANRRAFFALISVMVATFGTYVFIQLPAQTEYKSLIISTVVLGLLGGLAYYGLWKRSNKFVLFIILFAILIPYLKNFRAIKNPERKIPFAETGKYLHSTNPEEEELYLWIKNNTATNSLFVDTKLLIPLLSQRQLFIALDMEKTPGYKLDFLKEVCRYEVDMLQSRENIVKTIYESGESLSNEELKMLLDLQTDIYVVARKRSSKERFNPQIFHLVFRSSNRQFAVYQLAISSPDEGEFSYGK